MGKYIDKSDVLAEIENLLDKGKYHEEYDCAYRDGNNGALYALKHKLDTLEVKEVDLDFIKEVDAWVKDNENTSSFFNVRDLAKHFFELGISVGNKAQKGE